MFCVEEFAWASIEVPACDRIWFLVNFVISAAMSVSRMADSEAVMFSIDTLRLLIAYSKRF